MFQDGLLEDNTEQVEGEPVEGGDPVEDVPVEDAPVEGESVEQAEESQESQESQEPLLPGQRRQVDPDQEINWMRQQYAAALQRQAALQKKLEEVELADLDEEERERVRFQREREQWQAQMQQFKQQQQAAQRQREVLEWRDYWRNFSQNPVIDQADNPADMGHAVVTELYSRVQELEKENQALKEAVQPESGPQVTVGGQAPTTQKSLLTMSPDEQEKFLRLARLGRING